LTQGDDDEEEEEDDSNTMFDGTCRLFERVNGDPKPLGVVDLKILYDDDVYGARIVAVEHDSVSS
jgi:hypothetical protein